MKIEFQKIVNLLGTTSDDKDLPRFVTKKQIEVCVQSGINYDLNKEIRIKTPMLRSDLCDFSDSYIVVKGYIAITVPNNGERNKSVAFKNSAPFINNISKINGVQTGNAEDLDVVMPMYNLLEYSKNYLKKNKQNKQQAVCGIITEINQVILFLPILNILNTRQVLQEVLIMVIITVQTEVVKMKLRLLYH